MLDWEEGLFKGGQALFDALWTKRRRKPFQAAEITLASLRMEAFYLAHLLAGQKIILFETEDAVLRIGNRICLPRVFSGHADAHLNREFYLVKCGLAALSLQYDDYRDRLKNEYPALYDMWQRQIATLPEDFPWRGHFETIATAPDSEPAPKAKPTDAGDTENNADSDELKPDDHGLEKEATEIAGKGRTQVNVLHGEDLQAPDIPQHTFEKVETLEAFQGIDRQLDGADDIQDHEQALNELEMRHVLRSKDRAASIYQADILMSPFEWETKTKTMPKGIPYPEWDFRKKAYKENWCWLQVSDLATQAGERAHEGEAWAKAAPAKYGSRVRDLKRRLAQFSTDYLRTQAQPLGDELDLQAVLEARICMRTGGAPSENIYTHRRRDLADIATLVLVDLSDSTDAWVQGEHILETLRAALYCLGETLHEYTSGFGIAGFASDTRQACRYFPIKDIDAPWAPALPKLGALRAQGYTRMGPVLRHATRLLQARPERKKALLLITDGRPCDYDTYEGQYGIQDIKKAFAEAKEKGLITHAFAVDRKAREYFPAMFTPRQFSVIGKPRDLAEAIFRFFMALKSNFDAF